MNIQLRDAKPADAELMHRVSLQAWRGRVAETSSLYDETVDYVTGVLDRGGGLLLFIEGELAGSVRYFPLDHQGDCWEVKRLGVIAAHRKRGFGELMMNAVHARARSAGIARIQLGVRADQPNLVRFYEALGYKLDDTVVLSAQNPRTAAAITLSRRMDES